MITTGATRVAGAAKPDGSHQCAWMMSGRTSLATRRVVVADRGDETRHEQRSARIARRRHEPAAVHASRSNRSGAYARPHDLDVAESLTQWKGRVVGGDDGETHAVRDLRPRRSRRNGATGSSGWRGNDEVTWRTRYDTGRYHTAPS